ncbi:MAG: hypothetical protein ABIS08_09560 [Pseudolysinimonas sp.]
MRRRPLVIAIAVLGVAIVIGAGVVGTRAYLDAVKAASPTGPHSSVVSAATEVAYRQTVSTWPFALPPGEAFPKTPPSYVVVGQDTVRPFVSFFFLCAWQHRYLHGSASQKSVALTNIAQWERLPASISSADNSDNVWTHDVLVPAIRGDDGAMKRLYEADCQGQSYVDVVTTPAHGLPIDRPQLQPVSTASIINPCASYPTTAPCDPAFGPNLAIDLGTRDGARGTVTLDGAGVPRSYLVAHGDTFTAVTDRFGGANLWGLNCYRRSDTTLYAGDTLNLDKYTVATVGTENGSVASPKSTTATNCLTQSAVPPEQVTP